MKEKILLWVPRILAICFIIFMSVFALDVFGEYKFPQVLLALLMHLIPALVLIGITVLAWKKPFIGGIVFLVLAGIFTIFFKLYKDPISFLIIGIPTIITGILFILNRKQN
jgi:hypothetical protein